MTPLRPRVSFIICTFDRRALLLRCLRSLAVQAGGLGDAEILVIDNNSSDSTAEAVQAFRAEHSLPLRYVFEPEQGLSRARNAGCRAAAGEYLVYIDDDALLPSGYYSALRAVLDQHSPDLVGGPVLPYYDSPKPWWFRDAYETRQHAEYSGFWDSCRASGGNFTIRKEVLIGLGMFDPALGMRGGELRLGEERAVAEAYRRRTPATRRRAYYSLDCFVYHLTPAAKMQFAYQAARFFEAGRSEAHVLRKSPVRKLWAAVELLPAFAWGLVRALSRPGRGDLLVPVFGLLSRLGTLSTLGIRNPAVQAGLRIVWLYEREHTRHPFLTLGLHTLAQQGHAVTILDRSSAPVDGPYSHTPLPPAPRLPGTRFGRLRYAIDYGAFLTRVFFRTLLLRPEVVIATLPGSASAGWAAAALLGARKVYYPFELYGDQHVARTAFWRWMEGRAAVPGADAVITQNECRAQVYRGERGARAEPVLVHNYKPARQVRPAGRLRGLLGLEEKARIVLYEGQLTDGRWLEELVLAAAAFPPDAYLVLMGEEKKWWKKRADALLSRPGVAGRVLRLPEVPHDQVFGLAADADLGVIIYDDKVRNNYYCAPGKLSDYVLAGIPVVVPAFPTIGPLVRERGLGTVFSGGRPADIARAVAEALEVPRQDWQPAIERARAEFVWETQVGGFLEAVTGTKGPTPAGPNGAVRDAFAAHVAEAAAR